MENENTKAQRVVDFLEEDQVRAHFADINTELLRGHHFQQDEYPEFDIILSKKDDFNNFYRIFYSLCLKHEKYDNQDFFYLDCIDESKGKLGHSSRHRELGQEVTIIAIILINIYHNLYFEKEKIITWSMLKREIEESENKEAYKKLFFQHPKSVQTDGEWMEVQKRFKRAIREFTRLGWVKNLGKREDDVHIEIRASINRVAQLYAHELQNFNDFVERIQAL